MPRWLQVIGRPAALFLFALGVRALPWRSVFDQGRVYFVGNDAYYHARRILYSATHFPDVLRVDPYMNFPHGGEAIWSPLFDWALALLVWATVGPEDQAALERTIVWVPPLLGAATVLATYCLARRSFGEPAATLAALLLAVLPAHFSYSRLGFVDHHAAVSLASIGLLASAMRFCEVGASIQEGRKEEGRKEGWKEWKVWVSWGDREAWRRKCAAPFWLGTALGTSLLIWPGMLLHIALVEAACLAFLWSRGRTVEARSAAVGLAVAHAFAFALVTPFSIGHSWRLWGSFSPLVLSSFHPWFFSSLVLYFAIYAALCRRKLSELSTTRRLAMALLSGGGLLLASAPIPGELSSGMQDAWRWFAKGDSFQAEVAESRPLFLYRGQLSRTYAETYLSGFVYLVPVALVVAWRAFRRHRTASLSLLLWWTAALFVATLVQSRFFNSFSIAMALLIGWWLSSLWLHPRLLAHPSRLRRRALRAALLVLAVLLLLPCGEAYRVQLRNQLHWLSDRPPERSALELRKRMLVELADWLRENTEPTSGFLDPSGAQPEYAILSNWADGHVLEYVARRPTVANNFGDDIGEQNLVLADLYYQLEEQRASQILDGLRARYVILEYRPIRSRANLRADSTLSRLYFSDGEETDQPLVIRSGEARRIARHVAAATRHRLVYETAPKPYSPSQERPGFKVYEHVAGALLRGRAPPGTRVEARLPLETNRGRRVIFVSSSEADERGHYTLRLPYSNRDGPASIRSAGEYELRSAGQQARAVIREIDVLDGLVVAGPDFAAE